MLVQKLIPIEVQVVALVKLDQLSDIRPPKKSNIRYIWPKKNIKSDLTPPKKNQISDIKVPPFHPPLEKCQYYINRIMYKYPFHIDWFVHWSMMGVCHPYYDYVDMCTTYYYIRLLLFSTW